MKALSKDTNQETKKGDITSPFSVLTMS